MSDYGERKCLVCGKLFKPEWPQSVCCSSDCQKKRDKAKAREWKKIHRPMLREKVASLEKQFILLEQLVCKLHGMSSDELCKMYNLILDKAEQLKSEPEAKKSDADDIVTKAHELLPKMQECSRMQLTATSLPCGKRAECFNPKRCSKVPAGAKPVAKNEFTSTF